MIFRVFLFGYIFLLYKDIVGQKIIHSDWNHHEQYLWPGKCLFGKQQSPVSLNERFAYKKTLPPLQFNNFNIDYIMEIHNNGHTIIAEIPEDCVCEKPQLSGGGLKETFIFSNLHFHWPSEHIINGLEFDMEMHIVFYSNKYLTFEEAIKHPQAVTVLGILISVNKGIFTINQWRDYEMEKRLIKREILMTNFNFFNQVTNYTRSRNFEYIADTVEKINDKFDKKIPTKQTINFYDFLPYDNDIFFSYDGSLTTPKCNENINWFVYQNTTNIQYNDFKRIKNIYNRKYEPITMNKRDVQPVNARKIYIRDIG